MRKNAFLPQGQYYCRYFWQIILGTSEVLGCWVLHLIWDEAECLLLHFFTPIYQICKKSTSYEFDGASLIRLSGLPGRNGVGFPLTQFACPLP
jgi:hypothetical protein